MKRLMTPEDVRYSRESDQWRALAKARAEIAAKVTCLGFRPMFNRITGHQLDVGKGWRRQLGNREGTSVLLFLFLACEAEDDEASL